MLGTLHRNTNIVAILITMSQDGEMQKKDAFF